MFGEKQVNQTLGSPQIFRLRGQENALQAPQADGLDMLNPIQTVSSWTADTGVEENKDTFWSSPATGNLNQNVLCLHAPMCCAQLLPLLCFAIPSGVQTAEGERVCCCLALCSSGNSNNFSLSKPCSVLWGSSGFDVDYTVLWFLSVHLNVEWQKNCHHRKDVLNMVKSRLFLFLIIPLGILKETYFVSCPMLSTFICL